MSTASALGCQYLSGVCGNKGANWVVGRRRTVLAYRWSNWSCWVGSGRVIEELNDDRLWRQREGVWGGNNNGGCCGPLDCPVVWGLWRIHPLCSSIWWSYSLFTGFCWVSLLLTSRILVGVLGPRSFPVTACVVTGAIKSGTLYLLSTAVYWLVPKPVSCATLDGLAAIGIPSYLLYLVDSACHTGRSIQRVIYMIHFSRETSTCLVDVRRGCSYCNIRNITLTLGSDQWYWLCILKNYLTWL